MTDYVGRQLGSYLLTRLLGQGGSGHVYLGEHMYLKTQAAIKVLQMQLGSNDSKDFLKEARIIVGLKHPNIVPVLDFGMEDNVPFLVMDYASNGNLRQRYAKGQRIPLSEVVVYTKQVAAALQYAHSKELVHRDVKPENMLLNSDNNVWLSDFGIAVATRDTFTLTHSVLNTAGTIAYMAPEQLERDPRPASDQYALGVVVYEWLCGECPFDGSFIEIAFKHQFTPPPSLRQKVSEISRAVESVVMTALCKDPQHRFASVQAFASALERVYQVEQSDRSTINMRSSEGAPPSISTISAARVGVPEQAQAAPALTVIPGDNKCPYCSATIQAENIFCPNCGNKVSIAVPYPEWGFSTLEGGVPTIVSESKNKCSYCGSEIQAESKFCSSCGELLIHNMRFMSYKSSTVKSGLPSMIGTRSVDVPQLGTGTVRVPIEPKGDLSLPIVSAKGPMPVHKSNIIAQLGTESPPSSFLSYSTISITQLVVQFSERGHGYYRAKQY